jgi:hypothetical protein
LNLLYGEFPGTGRANQCGRRRMERATASLRRALLGKGGPAPLIKWDGAVRSLVLRIDKPFGGPYGAPEAPGVGGLRHLRRAGAPGDQAGAGAAFSVWIEIYPVFDYCAQAAPTGRLGVAPR